MMKLLVNYDLTTPNKFAFIKHRVKILTMITKVVLATE